MPALRAQTKTRPTLFEPGLTKERTSTMKLSEAFPSSFLKADDLNNQSVTVEISSVELTELGQGRDKETKLLVSFRGKEKKLVCNKTNAATIAKLYGDDTDGWIGNKVTLQPREVEFQGNMVLAIRVSLIKPGAPAAKPTAKSAMETVREPNENEDQGQGGESDEVPF